MSRNGIETPNRKAGEIDSMTPNARAHARRDWKPTFIEALRASGNVRYATTRAGISRQTAYVHRERDPKFAEDWCDAIDDFVDVCELELRRRAIDGVERIDHLRVGTDDKGNPVYEEIKYREYSDKLLMFMLRAVRPEKYRDNFDLAKLLREAAGLPQEPTSTHESGRATTPRLHNPQIKQPRARRSNTG